MRERNIKRTAIHLLGGVLAFYWSISCGPTVEWNSYGTVVEKKYTAPYPYTTFSPLFSGGIVIYLPVDQSHPEEWDIIVKVCTKPNTILSTPTPITCKEVLYSVNKRLYEDIEKGQDVNIPLK